MIARLAYVMRVPPHSLEETLEHDPRLIATILEVMENGSRGQRR